MCLPTNEVSIPTLTSIVIDIYVALHVSYKAVEMIEYHDSDFVVIQCSFSVTG